MIKLKNGTSFIGICSKGGYLNGGRRKILE